MGVRYRCEIKLHGSHETPVCPKCNGNAPMNPYILLIPVFIVCVIGSALCYTDSLRRAWWYVPVFVLLGAATNCLFSYGSKLLDVKEKVYTFSLYYDLLIMIAYYILPLLLFSTRPSTGTLVGTGVALVGIFIVKVYG